MKLSKLLVVNPRDRAETSGRHAFEAADSLYEVAMQAIARRGRAAIARQDEPAMISGKNPTSTFKHAAPLAGISGRDRVDGHAPMRPVSLAQINGELEATRSELEEVRRANEQLRQALADAAARGSESQRLAYHDGLTGLPNRLLLRQRLQERLSEAAATQQSLALMFIDLDNFKLVNDRHGHIAGDQLLSTVATRIAACVRAEDVACRYGGDEFVVLLSHISQADVASAIANAIRESINGRYWIEGHVLDVTASIGLAMYPADGDHFEALLHAADASMYRSKAVREESVPNRR